VDKEISLLDRNGATNKIFSVILADDHPVVRKALRDELAKETDFRVIAEACDGDEAVKLVRELTPDIVIIDIGMPLLNGIEATRQIKISNPDTIVLVLTVYDDIEHILGILESGADGYLTKDILVEDIVKCIHSVAAGETVLSHQVFQKVLKYALRHITKPLHLDSGLKLTSRELEILRLVAKGQGNKQIAHELNIGIRTVKSHLVDLFYKLKISSRTEAVIIGLRAGFLKPEDLD
jgi:NarL family two-component system response regulator LiaR